MISTVRIIRIGNRIEQALHELGLQHLCSDSRNADSASVRFAGSNVIAGWVYLNFRLNALESTRSLFRLVMHNRNTLAYISAQVGAPTQLVIWEPDLIFLQVLIEKSHRVVHAPFKAIAI